MTPVGGRGTGAGGKGRGGSGTGSALRGRLAALAKVAAALGAVWFAVEGGEYGTADLVRQRRAERTLKSEIDSLQGIVDSLTRYHKALRTDPLLQERIAREEFGMVKGPNELIYRFAEPGDTSIGPPTP